MLYHFWDIQCQIIEYPWNQGQGQSKVTENCTNDASYWSTIASIALFCIIFELLDTEYHSRSRNLGQGHSLLLEMVPCDRLHGSSNWHSIVSMTLSCIISEIGQKLWFFSYPTCIWCPHYKRRHQNFIQKNQTGSTDGKKIWEKYVY